MIQMAAVKRMTLQRAVVAKIAQTRPCRRSPTPLRGGLSARDQSYTVGRRWLVPPCSPQTAPALAIRCTPPVQSADWKSQRARPVVPLPLGPLLQEPMQHRRKLQRKTGLNSLLAQECP
eukprot:TRINITY_DN17308_c0_g1_i2.p2 TRINITY_DN17308_c0_g1~~TRINITY_DN17308_c0_g1_i2.p2  ORF type:complete len:119 (+),score=4.22 TRINITY_DN17308_c0_g1_i2:807-1163(+)